MPNPIFQDDEDGHLVVLTIIEELMTKRQEEFLDHFARLGVFSKVQSLMGSNVETESDVIKSQDDVAACSRSPKGEFLLSFNQLQVTNKTILIFRSSSINICRATRRRKRNLARQGLSLARLEHLPWQRLPLHLVGLGSTRTFKRL